MNHKALTIIGLALLMLIAHLVLLADFPLLWQAIAALLLAGWLPGMLLVEWLLGASNLTRWERVLYSIGASYTIMVVVMLFVSYLPGPVSRWQTFVAFDLVIILLLLLLRKGEKGRKGERAKGRGGKTGSGQRLSPTRPLKQKPTRRSWLWAGYLSLLLVGGFFRLTNLDYSEFQGDEARAALRAAAVIQGYEDVLLIHKKGPSEILIPTVIYSLTGHLNEQVARLPFALANLTGLFAIFLLGWRFFGPVAGWSAAILLALDGYFIGFARIVQYQSIVFLMSVLVVLLIHRLEQGLRDTCPAKSEIKDKEQGLREIKDREQGLRDRGQATSEKEGLRGEQGLRERCTATSEKKGEQGLRDTCPAKSEKKEEQEQGLREEREQGLREKGQALPLLAGLFLATGLLSHYEALLALLPSTFLFVASLITQLRSEKKPQSLFPTSRRLQCGCLLIRALYPLFPTELTRCLLIRALLPALIILASFYVPFVLHPHFSETFSYIADQRIGGQFPYNNLRQVFLLTTLYSTTYYVVLMIALAVIGVIAAYGRAFKYGWLLGIPIVLNLIFTIWEPTWLTMNDTDYTVIFFALVLWPIILLPRLKREARVVWLWFGVVSVVALFFTNRPYTHVYVFFIPWALLCGMIIEEGWQQLQARVGKGTSLAIGVPVAFCTIALFGTYAYWYFIYNEVEILANWHTERPHGFWTVYDSPPSTGIFGFPFKNGWKVIGVQYQEAEIEGIFDTNEKRDWTFNWYTRGEEFCQREHDYYFLIDRLLPNYEEARQSFAQELQPNHQLLANVVVNGKIRLQSYQKGDRALDAQTFELTDYEQRFDREVSDPYFKLRYPIISAPIQHPLRLRLGEHIWLEGYSLENDHARAGESVRLTLYWRPTANLHTSYTVFNQIIEPDTTMVGQLDAQPGCDKQTTNKWSVGKLVEDQYHIPIFPDAKPGTYPLRVGMYQPDPFENLPIYDANGQLIGHSIELTQITIETAP